MEHTKDAIINGEVRRLSDTEAEKASKFHSGRLAFIWINGELHFNKMGDTRDHQHWVAEDFGIQPDEFEKLPRGYCKRDRVQLFIGSRFKPLSDEHIKLFEIDFLKIALAQKKAFNPSGIIHVYNGVKIGRVGEVWPPIETINTYDVAEFVIPKSLE